MVWHVRESYYYCTGITEERIRNNLEKKNYFVKEIANL